MQETGGAEHVEIDAGGASEPPVRPAGPGWSVGALAVVGAIALLAGGGLVALSVLIGWHHPGLRQAMDRFETAATELPGVTAVTAEEGLGDTFVDPVDGYLDVRLGPRCTPDDVARTTAELRELVRLEDRYLLHPTVHCRGRGLTVSPDAASTAVRLDVYRQLAADPDLRAGVLSAPQIGDDPTPDTDNASLVLQLPTTGRVGATAQDWHDRLGARLPTLALVVSDSDLRAARSWYGVEPGVRIVAVGDEDVALLRIARRLDGIDGDGWYVASDPCTVAVRAPWSGPIADRIAAVQPTGCTLEWQTVDRSAGSTR